MIASDGKEVQMPISADASRVNGITDAELADCPTFKQLSGQLSEVFRNADWAGYNSNRFDVPMLVEEFLRSGVQFDMREVKLLDAYTIFQQHEPHNLSAAYKFYCNKQLENAHTANADTLATLEVLMAQVERYDDLPDTVDAIAEKQQTGARHADLAGYISYDAAGVEVFNFGKHKGMRVADVFKRDGSYYRWLQDNQFPQYTKQVFTRIYLNCKR
jgi:DNA polymerase-3 subunit epsilon